MASLAKELTVIGYNGPFLQVGKNFEVKQPKVVKLHQSFRFRNCNKGLRDIVIVVDVSAGFEAILM